MLNGLLKLLGNAGHNIQQVTGNAVNNVEHPQNLLNRLAHGIQNLTPSAYAPNQAWGGQGQVTPSIGKHLLNVGGDAKHYPYPYLHPAPGTPSMGTPIPLLQLQDQPDYTVQSPVWQKGVHFNPLPDMPIMKGIYYQPPIQTIPNALVPKPKIFQA